MSRNYEEYRRSMHEALGHAEALKFELEEAKARIACLETLAREAVYAWYDEALICTKDKPLEGECSKGNKQFPGRCDCGWPARNEPYRQLGVALKIHLDDSQYVGGKWVKA